MAGWIGVNSLPKSKLFAISDLVTSIPLLSSETPHELMMALSSVTEAGFKLVHIGSDEG